MQINSEIRNTLLSPILSDKLFKLVLANKRNDKIVEVNFTNNVVH